MEEDSSLEQVSLLLRLPHELLFHIARFLPNEVALLLRLVCRKFNEILSDASLWASRLPDSRILKPAWFHPESQAHRLLSTGTANTLLPLLSFWKDERAARRYGTTPRIVSKLMFETNCMGCSYDLCEEYVIYSTEGEYAIYPTGTLDAQVIRKGNLHADVCCMPMNTLAVRERANSGKSVVSLYNVERLMEKPIYSFNMDTFYDFKRRNEELFISSFNGNIYVIDRRVSAAGPSAASLGCFPGVFDFVVDDNLLLCLDLSGQLRLYDLRFCEPTHPMRGMAGADEEVLRAVNMTLRNRMAVIGRTTGPAIGFITDISNVNECFEFVSHNFRPYSLGGCIMGEYFLTVGNKDTVVPMTHPHQQRFFSTYHIPSREMRTTSRLWSTDELRLDRSKLVQTCGNRVLTRGLGDRELILMDFAS